MTAVAKLLPCPWCQKLPEDNKVPAGGGSYFFTVRCVNRGCSIQPETQEFDTPDAATAIWNRRAALSPAELGGVEDYVDPLDVFLSQGVDDVPCLQVPGRVLARFIPGSWDRAYEMFSGNTPTPRAAEAEWLPIEGAPKDGSYVLVANQHGAWIAKWHPVYQSGYMPHNSWASMMLNHDHIERPGRFDKPTHWRALTPPKENSDG